MLWADWWLEALTAADKQFQIPLCTAYHRVVQIVHQIVQSRVQPFCSKISPLSCQRDWQPIKKMQTEFYQDFSIGNLRFVSVLLTDRGDVPKQEKSYYASYVHLS